MKIMLIAAILITFPAITVALFFFGTSMMIPALASLGINLLPFIAAGWILRKSKQNLEH